MGDDASMMSGSCTYAALEGCFSSISLEVNDNLQYCGRQPTWFDEVSIGTMRSRVDVITLV
jgi:hypothetical protein